MSKSCFFFFKQLPSSFTSILGVSVEFIPVLRLLSDAAEVLITFTKEIT